MHVQAAAAVVSCTSLVAAILGGFALAVAVQLPALLAVRLELRELRELDRQVRAGVVPISWVRALSRPTRGRPS